MTGSVFNRERRLSEICELGFSPKFITLPELPVREFPSVSKYLHCSSQTQLILRAARRAKMVPKVNSRKELIKISKIAKFGCEML